MRMTHAVRITSIVAALDELLEPGAFADLGPNGLQVPGREEARRVVTGVSAQRELIDRAIELEAQLLLVHHGLFWDFHPTGLSPVLAERLRPLFKHDLALAAYHIPLDAHPEVGNNAILANALGCERHEAFGDFRGRAIGRAGTFPGDGVAAAGAVRARARGDGSRAARPGRGAGARAADRDRVGVGGGRAGRGERARP